MKAVFQTASSAVIFAESDFWHKGCKAMADAFFGKQAFAIAEIETGRRARQRPLRQCGSDSKQAQGSRTAVGGIRRSVRGMCADIGVRQNRAAGKTALSPGSGAADSVMPAFCFRLGLLFGRQVVGKFNHAHGILTCKIGNVAHHFIFWGNGMIFQTASRFECCTYLPEGMPDGM